METNEHVFAKTITIDAPPSNVWAALTTPQLMQKWMSETPIEIITDWQIGSSFTIKGTLYKKQFQNNGTVLLLEPERLLRYTHLSSLSRLPDSAENYTVFDFRLTQSQGGTNLALTINNFPTETIYKHLAFYWNVTLELLKRFIEVQESTDRS